MKELEKINEFFTLRNISNIIKSFIEEMKIFGDSTKNTFKKKINTYFGQQRE
jgi:hypothetical protein